MEPDECIAIAGGWQSRQSRVDQMNIDQVQELKPRFEVLLRCRMPFIWAVTPEGLVSILNSEALHAGLDVWRDHVATDDGKNA